MLTEISKSYSKVQIMAEKSRLEKKYDSIESLHQKFSVNKCRNPEYVDDYMIWKALNEDDTRITEKIVLKNLGIYGMMSPKRMEILDYLSSHNTKSIKTLASELKRNYKNVYDDIKALEKFGLVELIHDGRNKRPITKIDSILVMPDKKTRPPEIIFTNYTIYLSKTCWLLLITNYTINCFFTKIKNFIESYLSDKFYLLTLGRYYGAL